MYRQHASTLPCHTLNRHSERDRSPRDPSCQPDPGRRQFGGQQAGCWAAGCCADLMGVLRGASLLSSCAACRGGGSMLRVRAVTESTCALLLGSSCTRTGSLLPCSRTSAARCVPLCHRLCHVSCTRYPMGPGGIETACPLQGVSAVTSLHGNAPSLKEANLL